MSWHKGTIANNGCPEKAVFVGLSIDVGIGAASNSTGFSANVSSDRLGYQSAKTISGDNLKLSNKIGLGLTIGIQ